MLDFLETIQKDLGVAGKKNSKENFTNNIARTST